jgi:hypothetical protein
MIPVVSVVLVAIFFVLAGRFRVEHTGAVPAFQKRACVHRHLSEADVAVLQELEVLQNLQKRVIRVVFARLELKQQFLDVSGPGHEAIALQWTWPVAELGSLAPVAAFVAGGCQLSHVVDDTDQCCLVVGTQQECVTSGLGKLLSESRLVARDMELGRERGPAS